MQELVEVLFDGLSNRYAVWRSGSSRLICFVDSQEDADEVADVCAVKIALERGIPLESVAFKNEGALHDILPGLEEVRTASWAHLIRMLTGGDDACVDAAQQATQPMDEGAEAPQPTAISSSQPHNEGEAIEPAAPAAQLPKQVPDTVAASAQHAAARPDSLTPATAHSTPAAAAQAVGAAAAAAAAQGTPERSKRPAQAAGLSPRGGGKQQRVDLLLGIGSGLLPSAAQAEQQKAGQPRHCRVCSSGSPGPYASACWHRHPETKEEWLCHPCYGKALRQFRKKQAQQGQNQPAAQQPAGAPAPATAAVVAAQPEAAPPLSEQQPQQAAQAQVHAQKGTSGAPPAAEAPAHPPPPPQQLVEAQPAVPRTSLAEPSAAAAAPRPQHSHSGTQTGPTGPVAGAAAEVVPTARAAGADEVAQGAGGEPTQYHLYRQTKQALAACGAPAELRHAYLQQVFMRLPYELQWMHHDEVVDMQGEQAWDLLRQFIADEVALVERQRGGGIGGGPLGASPGDASGGSVPGR